MSKPLKIWCNVRLSPVERDKLRADIVPHELLTPTQLPGHHLSRGEPDPQLATADVAFGQPDPQQVIATPGIRWVHCSSAGYTRYDTPEFFAAMRSRGGAFSNSSGVYDEPCAQHLLAMMLAFSRQLPASWADQQHDHSWRGPKRRSQSFLLRGQQVVIYGFGAIGQRLAEMLQPFSMTIYAARRTPKGPNEVTSEAADLLLSSADHVVNTLPASPSTDRFFTAARFAAMKPTALFYNIGRGTTVDQPALLAALTEQRIAGAYLDVTDPEPLPPDSPLWTAPNTYITPHSGGGHFNEHDRVLAHFLENFRRFTGSGKLLNRIV
jgi:phosphoglycerate dehydrogenase-like enzyme